MKRKHSIETPVCPQERLVIISTTTDLSFALERIGPLAAIIIIVFYLLVLYLLALPNTPENPFASIYSESLIKTACQHLLLLVGFDTLIYRKYYDTPPLLVGHQAPAPALRPNYPNHSRGNNFNQAPPRPSGNNFNSTTPRSGGAPALPQSGDKSGVTCYGCRLKGHYSNECRKKMNVAPKPAAPAQQQRRDGNGKNYAPRNPPNPEAV
jgi:hypothetical protein